MKNKKYFQTGLLIAFLFSFQAGAKVPCDDKLQAGVGEAKLSPVEYGAQTRKDAIEIIKANNTPAFIKTTRNGPIPVILMSKDSRKGVEELVANSMGTQVVYQPDWNNDHGAMRFANNIIDVDSPGYRGFGEINETGIAWKPLPSYIGRRKDYDYKIVEVAYSLSKDEQEVVSYYQSMRRAAVIRVPFTFSGDEFDPNLPNLLLSGGEHCFIFCKASAVSSHLAEIDRNLAKLGLPSGQALMQNEDVKVFLKAIKEKMLAMDNTELSPEISKFMKEQRGLAKLFEKKLTPAKRRIALNWIIGYDASRRYLSLMQTLGVTGDVGYSDMNNPRASFVMIYDNAATAPAAFRNATYATPGKFSTWTATNQVPVK